MRRALLLIATLIAFTFITSLARADNAEAAVRAVVEAQAAALAAGAWQSLTDGFRGMRTPGARDPTASR